MNSAVVFRVACGRRGRRPLVWMGLCAAALLMGGCAATAVAPDAQAMESSSADADLSTTYGIHVEGLRLSAAGSMLDLRYRVVDPAKAAPLLNGKIQPYLLDEARKARLGVPDTPVLGRIRQTARNSVIHTDRTYFVMFGNPGKALRSGDKVTLLLGQLRVTELTVQ